VRLVPGFVDLSQVLPRHPGYDDLARLGDLADQVELELGLVERRPLELALPPAQVTVPAAAPSRLPLPPVPEAVATARATALADLGRLEQEMRAGLAEKIARREQEVEVETQRRIAFQRARLDEQLWQDKLAITRPQSQRLTALQLQVNNLRRLQEKGAVLAGQAGALAQELHQAQAELDQLRGSLDQQIASLEASYAERLEQYAGQVRAEAAQDLARYRREQTQDVENLVARGRAQLEQGLAQVQTSIRQVTRIEAGPTPTLDLGRLRAQFAAARGQASRDRARGIAALRSELGALRRQYDQLQVALARDTRETVQAVMQAQGTRVTFSPLAGRVVPNRTPQAIRAVTDFWRAAIPGGSRD
jgi:hypothetical protein